MSQHELAARAVLEREGFFCARVDQLGVDKAARAEVHPVLLFALTPQGHADIADPHRLGDLRTPALLELRAECRLAAAGLAGDQYVLDGGVSEVERSGSRG